MLDKEEIKELDQLLCWVGDIFNGWQNEDFWTDWDAEIYRKVIQFRTKHTYEK